MISYLFFALLLIHPAGSHAAIPGSAVCAKAVDRFQKLSGPLLISAETKNISLDSEYDSKTHDKIDFIIAQVLRVLMLNGQEAMIQWIETWPTSGEAFPKFKLAQKPGNFSFALFLEALSQSLKNPAYVDRLYEAAKARRIDPTPTFEAYTLILAKTARRGSVSLLLTPTFITQELDGFKKNLSPQYEEDLRAFLEGFGKASSRKLNRYRAIQNRDPEATPLLAKPDAETTYELIKDLRRETHALAKNLKNPRVKNNAGEIEKIYFAIDTYVGFVDRLLNSLNSTPVELRPEAKRWNQALDRIEEEIENVQDHAFTALKDYYRAKKTKPKRQRLPGWALLRLLDTPDLWEEDPIDPVVEEKAIDVIAELNRTFRADGDETREELWKAAAQAISETYARVNHVELEAVPAKSNDLIQRLKTFELKKKTDESNEDPPLIILQRMVLYIDVKYIFDKLYSSYVRYAQRRGVTPREWDLNNLVWRYFDLKLTALKIRRFEAAETQAGTLSITDFYGGKFESDIVFLKERMDDSVEASLPRIYLEIRETLAKIEASLEH